jgi:SWIM zinc finger
MGAILHMEGTKVRVSGDKLEGRMAPETSRRNAISLALARGGAAAVRRVRYGHYRVESASRPGAVHTVSVDARGRYRCSCEAGVAGRPACWHRAAVLIAKVEQASRGKARVTGAPSGRAAEAPELLANVTLLRRAA